MADNLTTTTTVATVPSGTVIATDDVGSVHYQKVKIDVGADGASALLGTANPLPVSDAGGTLSVDDGAGSLTVDNAGTFAVQAASAGDVAHDAADSGNPVKMGGKARTTNPTAVADGDRVNAAFDDLGRQVVCIGQARDLMTHAHTQIASSSSETTILAAGGAGVYHDLTQLVITNQTATAVNVTIKDATAGTTRMILALAASGGIVLSFPRPVTQASAANNWTATLSSAAVTVNFFVQAEKNV